MQNSTLAIRPSVKLVQTSESPLLSWRQVGIPIDQPYSTVLMSLPIQDLSSLLSDFNQTRTGSVPTSV